MGSYIPCTAEERKAMLAELGLKEPSDLFSHIPAEVRTETLDIPQGMSEEKAALLRKCAQEALTEYKQVK